MLAAIERLPAGSMERLQRIEDAVDALISPDPLRREFLGHERLVEHALQRGEAGPGGAGVRRVGSPVSSTIADAIRAKLNPNPADISGVMGRDQQRCSTSRSPASTIAREGPPPLDLSKIDFEALAQAVQGIEAQEHRARGAEGRHPRAARTD